MTIRINDGDPDSGGTWFLTSLDSIRDTIQHVYTDPSTGSVTLKYKDLASYYFPQKTKFSFPPEDNSKLKPSKRPMFKFESQYLYDNDTYIDPDSGDVKSSIPGWPKELEVEAVIVGNLEFTVQNPGDDPVDHQFLLDHDVTTRPVKKEFYTTYYDGNGDLVALYGSDSRISKKISIENQFYLQPILYNPNGSGDNKSYELEDILQRVRTSGEYKLNTDLSNSEDINDMPVVFYPRLVNNHPTVWREAYGKTVDVIQINSYFEVTSDGAINPEVGIPGDFLAIDQYGYYFRIPQEDLSENFRSLNILVEAVDSAGDTVLDADGEPILEPGPVRSVPKLVFIATGDNIGLDPDYVDELDDTYP